MIRLLAVLLTLSLPNLLLAQAKQDPPQKTQPKSKAIAWTPEEMMKVKQISSVQVSPDGQRVAYAVREAVMAGDKSEYLTHVHVANADGRDSLQLTQGEKSCTNPQWSPDGEWIAFTSSRSGKENIWVIRVRGGEAERVTDVKTGVGGFKWSPDGTALAFTALDPPTAAEEKAGKQKNDARVVDGNIKMNRLFVIAIKKDAKGKREARRLTTGSYSVGSLFGAAEFDWSPDGKTIAFTHMRSPKADDWPSADISLVEVASATVKPLANSNAAERAPVYSPDGQWIAYVASDNPPTWAFHEAVHVVSATGGTPRPLTETLDRNPRLEGWSGDNKKIYFSEARGTTTRLYALPLAGALEEISNSEGVISTVHLNQTRSHIGFGFQTLDKPPEAFISYADRFAPVPISHVNDGLPHLPLGRTEVLRWKSADDLEIEGLLTYPVGYEKGKRYPLLLIIHGGPTGVFQQSYVASPGTYPVAAFAGRGYAVLRCNPRGSGGYGKKFRYANYGDWGGKDFQDLMAGVDHAIDMGVADADRLGVMGWSYGGFMTSWVITQTKRFKAASVGAGVTNLMSFNGTSDIPSFVPDYFGGDSWDKLDSYRAHSALFQVKGVTTPTLIQHGEKDVRVPISQGYELYNALKRQGCTVKMVVYPRTPHGPQEPKLLLDIMSRNVQWFDQYVRGDDGK